jgi:hypothetical protein
MHTIKPLDVEAVDLALQFSKLIVTVEEYSIKGGLCSAIAEYKAPKQNAPSSYPWFTGLFRLLGYLRLPLGEIWTDCS